MSNQTYASLVESIPTEYDIARNLHEEELTIKKQLDKPQLVFKYKGVFSHRDFRRLRDIFKNKRLYMSPLDQLNDPLESACTIWLGSEAKRQKAIKDYRVLALSKEPLLSTMWAYYANNYEGICFGFKTNKTFAEIEEVTYHASPNSIEWEFCIDDLFKKGVAWQHEAEYRIVRHSKAGKYFKFDIEDLACVILGNKLKPKFEKRIKSLIPKNVPIFTLEIDTSEFCLCAKHQYKVYSVDELINAIDTFTKE